MTTTDTAADPARPDAPSKRKRRTFTLSDDAYDTLTEAAKAGDGNRSGLLERYIFEAATSVALDAEAHATLLAIAEAGEVEPSRIITECIRRYDDVVILPAEVRAALETQAETCRTDPARLLAELVERAGAILTWTQPAPPPPWWQFWRRSPATQKTPASLAGWQGQL